MTPKFNTKTYQDKERVYSAVPKAPRISRLWIWDEITREYKTPASGNVYYAAKYETDAKGEKRRMYKSFATLEEARIWQYEQCQTPVVLPSGKMTGGPSFGEMMEEWKRRRYPHIAYSTQVQYDKVLRLHFASLLNLSIYEVTPQRIDAWLDELKANTSISTKRKTRISYGHELSLLSTILKYYRDYYDDSAYQFPIKQRHREASRLNRSRTDTPKDLSEVEFLKFREELRRCKNGEVLASLATVQFFQALRISEAAGLYWEDVHLDWNSPWNSRIKIVRSVCYPHRGKEKPFVKGGFKNSKGNRGVKEQPVFPEVFDVFKALYKEGASGLIFELSGKPIPFCIIQSHFNRSFKRAELPYRGTHVMRHGGCRRVFNEVGELSIAQQLLGNSDLKTTLVYAQRHAGALTDVVHGYWDKKKSSLLANACNEEIKTGK